MDERTRVFTYTGRRGSYAKAVAPFAGLLAVEVSVLVLLILTLVHRRALRLALLAGCAALCLTAAIVLSRTLRTRHRLTATHLEIRYGSRRLDLPREALAAARPVRQPLELLWPLRLETQARRQRLVASFSEEGQVLLRLDRPRRLSISGVESPPIGEVLLNVDRRDDLLAALGLPEEPAPIAAVSGERSATALAAEKEVPAAVASSSSTAATSSTVLYPQGLALEARGLRRHFGSMLAVDSLDLAIGYGEVYGFLGPNGAGKTTTIKMLVGLLKPEAGRVAIAGHDVWAVPLLAKAAFGFVPDRSLVYDRLTGREFLEFLAQMRGLPRAESAARIDELLSTLQLAGAADRLAGGYSFGMRRKLALAGALLSRPSVLILDEPFNGLDPQSARRLKDLLAGIVGQGAALFLSIHDLATAESFCHRVGILHRGRLLTEGTPEELRRLVSGPSSGPSSGSNAAGAAPDLEAVFLQLTAEEPAEIPT